MTRTSGWAWNHSREPSRDPLSTTTISVGCNSWALIDPSMASQSQRPFQLTATTDTAGGPEPPVSLTGLPSGCGAAR